MDATFSAEARTIAVARAGNGRVLAAYLLFALAIIAIMGACYALRLDTIAASAQGRAQRLIQLGLLTGVPLAFLAWLRRMPLAAPPMLPAWPVAACAGLALLGAALIGTLAVQSVPLSSDETAYLYQAELFGHGRLWASVTPIQDYISQSYIFQVGDRLISQYPPGWPGVIAAAGAAGIPATLVNPIIGALTVLALHRFAAVRHGREVAGLAAVTMAASAFFLFNAAAYLNGSITALLGVLFAGAAASFIERPRARAAIGAGIWFSAIAAMRHFDALLFAAPAGVVLLRRGSMRHWARAPLTAAGAAPLLALLVWYYWRITGQPFEVPQTLRHPDDHLLGPNWHLRRAIEILAGRVVELAEWISPPFVIAFGWALARAARRAELRFYDFFPLVFLGGYFLYWGDGGLRWGPRYIFPVLPFMALLVARGVWQVLQRADGRRRATLAHLGVMSLVIAIADVPFLAARARELVGQTQDIFRQAHNAGLHDAVVIATTGTGLLWHIDIRDLARNGLAPDQDIVYAHGPDPMSASIAPADLRRTIADLHAYFPTRRIWLYSRAPDAVEGKLVEAEAAARPAP